MWPMVIELTISLADVFRDRRLRGMREDIAMLSVLRIGVRMRKAGQDRGWLKGQMVELIVFLIISRRGLEVLLGKR